MSIIEVETNQCTRCGACVSVCPMVNLDMVDNTPFFSAPTEKLCIACGHCVAVCPVAAMENQKTPKSSVQPIDKQLLSSPESIFQSLRMRRSIRSYTSQTIARTEILKLLEITRYAPSGSNSQGISYLIVEGKDNLNYIKAIVLDWFKTKGKVGYNFPYLIKLYEKGQDIILRNAPHLIIALADKPNPMARDSSCLQLSYLDIYAQSSGLGTCWAGFVEWCASEYPALTDFLRIPAEKKISGAMLIGYPRYTYHKMPDRNALNAQWFAI